MFALFGRGAWGQTAGRWVRVPMLRRCLCRGNGKRSLANLVGHSGGPKWIGADLVLMGVRGIAMS